MPIVSILWNLVPWLLKDSLKRKTWPLYIECKECPYKTKNPDILRTHIAEMHNKTLTKCQYCQFSSVNNKALVQHGMRCSSKVSYMCQKPNVSSPLNQDRHKLQEHISGHRIRFKCEKCPFTSFDESHVIRHREEVHTPYVGNYLRVQMSQVQFYLFKTPGSPQASVG